MVSIRRRKRKNIDANRAVLIAVPVLCTTILIPYIVHLIISGGKSSNDSNNINSVNNIVQNSNNILQKWKPKVRRRAGSVVTNPEDIPSLQELDFQQRAQQREDRYNSLYKPKFDESTLGYDIYNCPHTPPKDYPMQWKATEVLSSWSSNDVTTTTQRNIYQGLCTFDYQTQYAAALNYRKLEKPFIIRNDPKVVSTAIKWEDDPEYLHRTFGDVEEFRTERSPNNMFMWYRLHHKKAENIKGYVKPLNDEIEMSFGEFLEHAIEKDGKALGDSELIDKANKMRERRMSLDSNRNGDSTDDDPLGKDEDGEGEKDEDSEEAKRKKYYYFRVNADLRKASKSSTSQFIYDELPFFDPRKRKDSQFYIVDPKEERGINCRFGMRGVTAANHFDMSRNMITVFGGERRYILASPNQCKNMALYPQGHPSVRHSSIELWSNPLEWDEHPEFKHAHVNEVVLHAGDVLYLESPRLCCFVVCHSVFNMKSW